MSSAKNVRDVSNTPGGAVSLPNGYPAYCVYIPTGMSQDFEKATSDKLLQWGTAMGANLFVAPWNVGDVSYVQLMQKLGFTRRPAIILTDDPNLSPESFIMKIDDPLIIRDVARLTNILPDAYGPNPAPELQPGRQGGDKREARREDKVDLRLSREHPQQGERHVLLEGRKRRYEVGTLSELCPDQTARRLLPVHLCLNELGELLEVEPRCQGHGGEVPVDCLEHVADGPPRGLELELHG